MNRKIIASIVLCTMALLTIFQIVFIPNIENTQKDITEPKIIVNTKKASDNMSFNKREKKENIKTQTKKDKTKKTSDYYIHPDNYHIKPKNDNVTNKVVTLTFDDAPQGDITFKFLNILDEHNIKAIFFVIGEDLINKDGSINKDKKEIITEIKKRGHLIGNHTYSHVNMRTLEINGQYEKLKNEIIKTNNIIEEITGEKPFFIRPPFAAYSNNTKMFVKEFDMQLVTWSVGSLDWEYSNPNAIKNQTLNNLHNGGNIAMHLVPQTEKILNEIITEIKKREFEFVLPNGSK